MLRRLGAGEQGTKVSDGESDTRELRSDVGNGNMGIGCSWQPYQARTPRTLEKIECDLEIRGGASELPVERDVERMMMVHRV